MSDGFFSRLLEDGRRKEAEAKSEEYAMVNVRPGEKVAAMLDLMSQLRGKSPSAIMADELSNELAAYAVEDSKHGPAILEAAALAIEQDGFWGDGALARLREWGVIEEESSRYRTIRDQILSIRIADSS